MPPIQAPICENEPPEDKHKQQLEILEHEIDRLKWSYNTLKQFHEQQNRISRLTTSLGFNDIYEAQMTIDNADHDVTYAACVERAHRLEAEVTSLRDRVQHLEEERDVMQQKLDANSKASVELTQLRARYNDLLSINERATERYQADYKTWKTLKEWLFKVESDEDQQKSVRRKRKLVLDHSQCTFQGGCSGTGDGVPDTPLEAPPASPVGRRGADHPTAPHPPLGNVDYLEDKEGASVVGSPRDMTPKSALPPLPGATPANAQIHVKPLTPVAVNRLAGSNSQCPSASSDTEDDSQAADPFANMLKIFAVRTPIQKAIARSTGPSGAQGAPPLTTPSCVSNPTPGDSTLRAKPLADDSPNIYSLQDGESSRPWKTRRLSERPEIVQEIPSRPTFMGRERGQDGSQPRGSKTTPGGYSASKGRGH